MSQSPLGTGSDRQLPVSTGQKLLDSLAETWDFFFSDVLPTLQAIFYPVQVSGPWATLMALPGLSPDCLACCHRLSAPGLIPIPLRTCFLPTR